MAAKRGRGRITILLPPESQALIDRFVSMYVVDRNRDFWWESLAVEAEGEPNRGAEGLRAVERVAANWGQCTMIVTDERAAPRLCLVGPARTLIDVRRASWRFEYVLISGDFQRFVCDTHMKTLLWFGGREDLHPESMTV